MDRSISVSMFKLSENKFVLSAKILDIKDRSILSTTTVQHMGSLDTIDTSLEKLSIPNLQQSLPSQSQSWKKSRSLKRFNRKVPAPI